MKKTFLPIILCLFASVAIFSAFKASGNKTSLAATRVSGAFTTKVSATEAVSSEASAKAAATMLYDSLHLDELGLSSDAMVYAYKGYMNLVKEGKVNNDEVLTVIDFSQPSSKKRMYILDVKNFKVLHNTYVAHGKNSGLTYAEKFSNKLESLQSSLGFYVTRSTYSGKHGLSLRLDGLEAGWNDKAMQRAVVVHGAQYIGENRANSAYMGRSFGCPAVPQAQASKVINMIKDGTTMFIYHPSNQYLKSSKILNS